MMVLFALLAFLGCRDSEKKERSSPPNIILFMVDDLGWQDTSVPFWEQETSLNQRYHTPNMERLAAEGMKFTQAYATPVCSPSRISLMTGMNAARHRVTNWTLHKDQLQPMETEHDSLVFPDWNVNGLSAKTGDPRAVYATPLPQLLKKAGYYTIHSGKAHFGAQGTSGEDPKNLGFDINIAGHAAGAPKSYYGTENFGNLPGEKEVWAVPGLEAYHGNDVTLTEAITWEAMDAIDSALVKQRPFFLYLSHYAVHTPLMEDKRFFKKYLEQGLDSTEARYASMVEGMDDSLGNLMDFLEEKKLDDDTIILFMSDNGGLSAVARGGEIHRHNQPLASGKGSAYEGGIRVPMIVKWPGKVRKGVSSDHPVIIEDFYPTLLKMAEIHDSEFVQTVDGQSFIGSLRNPEATRPKRPLIWHFPNEWGPSGPGIGAFSAIRLGDWKLIYFHQDEQMELYNLEVDLREKNNLLDSHPSRVEALAKTLSDYLRKVEAQMPLDKKTGEKIPMPDAVIKTMSR